MATQHLIEYLSSVAALEKDVNEQECLIRELDANILQPAYVSSPRKPYEPKVSLNKTKASFVLGIIPFTFIVFLGWAIAGGIITEIIFPQKMGESSTKQHIAIWVITIIAFIIWIFYFLVAKETIQEKKDIKLKYENDVKSYEEELSNNANKIELQKQKAVILANDKAVVEKQLQNTKSVLEQYYSLNILYPKYRGYIPVTSILDYLLSGVCTELTGYEGAYNKFDQELLMNKIIDRLDKINSNLEQIRINQIGLYNMINSSNAQISSLLESINRNINNNNLQLVNTISNYGNKILAHQEAIRYSEKINQETLKKINDLQHFEYLQKNNLLPFQKLY